jgi:hypothetical protein
MQIPEWLKPGLYGAACGAVALAVIGFSWGGVGHRRHGSHNGRRSIESRRSHGSIPDLR